MNSFKWKALAGLLHVLSTVGSSKTEKRDFDVFEYVDPLIGTDSGGKNTLFPFNKKSY